jgi:hypothetical protein
MTITKSQRRKNGKPFHEAVTDLLFSALANHEDFILTYETDPETDKKEIHVMTGKFITNSQLRTLKKKCERQHEDGSRHITRKMRQSN